MSNKNKSSLDTIIGFIPYLWDKDNARSNHRVLLAVFFLILQKLITVVVPLIYGRAVDIVSEKNFVIATLFAVIGAYVLSRLFQQIFDELKYYIFARVQQRAVRTLALRVFNHLHHLSLRFHLDRQTGGVSRVIERGTKSIEFLLMFVLFNIIPTIVEIILVCIIFWWLFGWYFSITAMITIVGYIVYTILITEWRIKFRRRMNEFDKTANTYAVDSLINYETVKYFNAEEHESMRYDKAMRRYEDAAVKNRTSLSLLNVGQGFIIATGMAIIMFMAGMGVSDGAYSVGMFAAVNMYLLQLYLPLNFLGSVYREIRQALIDMEEMFALLDHPVDVIDIPQARALKVCSGKIDFSHVSFSYARREKILHDISFTINGGEKTAIVGASGSGKTTITRLLYRFYDVDSGTISIDGVDINQCQQKSVRQVIGVVPQDTVLFNNTLRHNLLYGNPMSSEEELQRAIELAEIKKFITSLPDGLDTIVGERGLKLSGGEKQRVAIARVILKNPKIYIFDEATSALDTKTEKSLQHAFNDISYKKTTLVIAHRLSTIVDAHKIIVLANGTIAEEGNHQSLLRNNGLYASLWYRQEQKK